MKFNEIKRIIKEGLHDMSIIWANEMKMTVKDEAVLIFFLLASTIYPLLYSWIYNNEVVREVPVAVVDYSHSAESREYIRLCNASPDVNVAYHCTSLTEAKDLVGRQQVKGVLFFPSDFDTNIHRGEQRHESDVDLQGHLPNGTGCVFTDGVEDTAVKIDRLHRS